MGVSIEWADLVRVLIWPGELYLLVRMGWRAAFRPERESNGMMAARSALAVLFFANAITAATRWHQPFTWTVTPFVLLAIVLVWASRDL